MYQILEDGEDNLWMGSNTGVFRVNKAGLEEYAAGRRTSITSTTYDTADGMKSRECVSRPASGWKTADGKLWFATTKGVAVVDPARLARNEQPPPVIIERMKVNDQPRELGASTGAVRLAAGTERVEFEYTGLSFVAPEKVSFKYKLEGFDRNWVDAGTRRMAFYTNLSPGDYRFRVIAANNDGVWNEQGTTLRFNLQPYFYQTMWFYLLCGAAVLVAAWEVYRLRLRQVLARYNLILAERERISGEIHDTLAQSFTGVVVQLETALRQPAADASREHITSARDLARQGLQEARRAVRALRPEILERGDLPASLTRFAEQMTRGTNIQAEVQVSGTPRPLPVEVEANLLRIAQEAFTNALRHAHPRHIVVEVSYEERSVQLRVVNDGRGFDSGQMNGGFGLQGMRERAERLGGELRLNSTPNEGTEVVVKLSGKSV